MAQLNTTGMSSAIKTLYEKQLLARALPRLVHCIWGQKSTFKGFGSYELRRYESLVAISATLTEGVTPEETARPLITTFTITPSWYGTYIQHTDKLSMTDYDPVVGVTVELMGEQAALSVENLARASLVAGATADYAGGASATTDVDATNDKITFADYIYNVAALDAANARPVEGGDYIVVLHPYSWATLMQDSTFVAMFTREADGNAYRDGLMGRILKTRVYVSSNAYTQASDTTVYTALFIAWQSFAITGFAGLTPNYGEGAGSGEYSNMTGQTERPLEIIMKDLGETGFDPLNQRGTCAWKLTHDLTVLKATWLRDLQHATVASA